MNRSETAVVVIESPERHLATCRRCSMGLMRLCITWGALIEIERGRLTERPHAGRGEVGDVEG